MSEFTDEIKVGLAELIAIEIMALGDEPDSKCLRIQFMGGTYPDNEKEQGGLCKQSLAEQLEIALKKHGLSIVKAMGEGE